MNFGQALEAMRGGHRVSRDGWNGRGLWLMLCSSGRCGSGLGEIPLDPFLVMKTVGGTFVPWLASQTDLLADDWTVL